VLLVKQEKALKSFSRSILFLAAAAMILWTEPGVVAFAGPIDPRAVADGFSPFDSDVAGLGRTPPTWHASPLATCSASGVARRSCVPSSTRHLSVFSWVGHYLCRYQIGQYRKSGVTHERRVSLGARGASE